MVKKNRKAKTKKKPVKNAAEAKIDYCAIDPHFDGGGWDLLDNPGAPGHSVGEVVLWRRVVLQALFDFLSQQDTACARFNRDAAERWFLKSQVQFRHVCELADINAEKLRGIIARAVEQPGFLIELRWNTRRP